MPVVVSVPRDKLRRMKRGFEKPLLSMFALIFWAFARILPVRVGSELGAFVLGHIGPRLRKQKQVMANLRVVFPAADENVIRDNAQQMWRNFGAVLFEFPHLEEIYVQRTTVRIAPGAQALLDAGEPFLMVTGHLANWELLACFLGHERPGTVIVYSPSGTELVDRLVQRFRRAAHCRFITKPEAIRRLTPRYLEGSPIGMVTDVRVDSAPMVPFFGIPAPTTITPARIALRLGYPFIPGRVTRVGKARFEMEICEPLMPSSELSGKAAALELTQRYHAHLEHWIRDRPGEWLCTKRRWQKNTVLPD